MTISDLPNPFHKIAVLHAKALGDFIVTLPALAAIKETYPATELVLLGKPWIKEFLSSRPSPVDRVVTVPSLPGINDSIETKGNFPERNAKPHSLEIEGFLETMRAEKFDVVVHMQGDGKSVNPFINSLGAGLTAGMRNLVAEPIDRAIPYVHYQSEILRNLEIVSLIGARTAHLEPHVELTGMDEQETVSVKERIGDKPYVVIHSGADDMRRVWPAVKFAETADRLVERGYEIVLTGTPKEEEIVLSVTQAMRYAAIPCTSLKLGGLAALLKSSSLVISNDTGPLHLARAVGAPTVGIYWGPNVLNWGPLSRNRHRIAISWQTECPKCHIMPVSPWPFQPITAGCDHPYSFVESVPVAEVLGLALGLLPSE